MLTEHWRLTQGTERFNAGDASNIGETARALVTASRYSHHESVDDIMQELLVHERKGIELYRQLLNLSEDRSVSLEEFARQKIRNEEMHVAEIEKMLRRRGDA